MSHIMKIISNKKEGTTPIKINDEDEYEVEELLQQKKSLWGKFNILLSGKDIRYLRHLGNQKQILITEKFKNSINQTETYILKMNIITYYYFSNFYINIKFYSYQYQ